MNTPLETPSHTRPDGATAIVTGAARGLGRAITEQLLRDGWGVVAIDLDGTGLAELEADIAAFRHELGASVSRAEGGEAPLTTMVGDVTDRNLLAQAVTAGNEAGNVVGAVANAGIFLDGRIPKLKADDWNKVINVDLTAPFLLTQAVWDSMVTAGYGRLVYISSVSKDGNFGQANYAAAKSGLVGLAQTAAIEGGKHGITSNVICPGSIDTPLNLTFKRDSPLAYERFLSRVPLGRAGQPHEIASASSWFMSDNSSYITGQVLYVDGGMSCGYS